MRMRNILVPTDFSNTASFAIKAAAQLAQRHGATLHLLHGLDIPVHWEQLSEAQREDYPEKRQAYHNTQVLLQDICEQYPALNTTQAIRGGRLPEAVKHYTEEHGIDLIVLGSHGASGKNEFFIGSNAQKIVRSVHRPVLIIKNDPGVLAFDKVVFASSFDQAELRAFQHFRNLVKPFLPEIHLVVIHTASFFDPPYVLSQEAMQDFKEACTPLVCETHVFTDLTIDQGIRTFSREIGAKLIGISNAQRHPLKRMLVGSNVEALVNHANLPVLSIDYPLENS